MDYSQRWGSPGIAYVLKCFPRPSETFILHEILELERQGLSLRLFSLLEPSSSKVATAVQEVKAPVSYVPQNRWALLPVLGARFLRHPWRFLRVSWTTLVHYRQPGAFLKHVLYAAYLAREFERSGITHIHAHYANTPAAVAQLIHQFTGISYSFTAHAKDIYLSRPAALTYRMEMARFVVTCTAYNQRYLEQLISRDQSAPLHCIYHGLNLRAFPAGLATPPTQPLLLTVARLVEKKGLSYLLRACRILVEQGYDFTCRIVGEGPLRPVLEQEIRELELSERVVLWGAEKHERVIEMYQHATLAVLPCVISENGDRDGIPNALVEALYLGVPAVSTPVSGIPELITSEVNGLLVTPGESMELATAIARLLADQPLRARLALAGRQTVLARFDMAHNATRLLHLLLTQTTAPALAFSRASECGVPMTKREEALGSDELAGTGTLNHQESVPW